MKGMNCMNINKMLNELLELKQKGLGDKEVVIWEEHPITKEKHHTTVEDVNVTAMKGLSYLQYDKEKIVVELLT